MRFTVPIGNTSMDFPQNLFFHLTSEVNWQKLNKLQCFGRSLLCIYFQKATHYQLVKRLNERARVATRSSTHGLGNLPCQKVKFFDSQWQAEMGGWWLTWETRSSYNDSAELCARIWWSSLVRNTMFQSSLRPSGHLCQIFKKYHMLL